MPPWIIALFSLRNNFIVSDRGELLVHLVRYCLPIMVLLMSLQVAASGKSEYVGLMMTRLGFCSS